MKAPVPLLGTLPARTSGPGSLCSGSPTLQLTSSHFHAEGEADMEHISHEDGLHVVPSTLIRAQSLLSTTAGAGGWVITGEDAGSPLRVA